MKPEWFFFKDFQSHLVRLVIGIAAFAVALPPLAEELTRVYTKLNYEFVTKIYSIVYFGGPVLMVFLMWIWWVRFANQGFLRIGETKFSKKLVLSLIFISLSYLAFLFCYLGCFFDNVNITYLFGISLLIFTLIQFIYLGRLIQKYFRIKYQDNSTKEYFLLGWTHFGVLIFAWTILLILFYQRSHSNFLFASYFKDKSSKELVYKYESLHDSLTMIANNFTTKKEQIEKTLWLHSFDQGKLSYPKPNVDSFQLILEKHGNDFSHNFQLIDSFIKIDSNIHNIVLDLSQKAKLLLELPINNPGNLDSLYHSKIYFEQLSILSQNAAIESRGKFIEKFSPYLKKIISFGTLLLFATLLFLCLLWLHIFLANLTKYDKEVHELKIVEESDFKEYPQIKFVKGLLLLVFLMILPSFRDLSKESLFHQNPLQPFFLKQGGFGKPKEKETIVDIDSIKYTPETLTAILEKLNGHFDKHHKEVNVWLQKMVSDRHDKDTLIIDAKFR